MCSYDAEVEDLFCCGSAVLKKTRPPPGVYNNVLGNMTRAPDTDKPIFRLRVSNYSMLVVSGRGSQDVQQFGRLSLNCFRSGVLAFPELLKKLPPRPSKGAP
jgi:hypothetical protein